MIAQFIDYEARFRRVIHKHANLWIRDHDASVQPAIRIGSGRDRFLVLSRCSLRSRSDPVYNRRPQAVRPRLYRHAWPGNRVWQPVWSIRTRPGEKIQESAFSVAQSDSSGICIAVVMANRTIFHSFAAGSLLTRSLPVILSIIPANPTGNIPPQLVCFQRVNVGTLGAITSTRRSGAQRGALKTNFGQRLISGAPCKNFSVKR